MGAKLFGLAAVTSIVIALVPSELTNLSFDLYMHDTYFVVESHQAVLGFALLCVLFAGFYYLGDRLSGQRLKSGFVVAHFLLWIFAIIAFWVGERALLRAVISRQDPSQSSFVLGASAAAVLAFLVGGLTFVVNFAWAMVSKRRAS